MVLISLPPPRNSPSPRYFQISSGEQFFRIYDPTSYGQTATSFKKYGPNARFDHHRHPATVPAIDHARGIYYAGPTFSGCIAEYFGDRGSIVCAERHLALVRARRNIRLLDLCGDGAMCAGTVAALSKTDHPIAQEWSRFFYEYDVYQFPEGIRYYNAHNDEVAYALYERCEDAIEMVEDLRLDDPGLLGKLAFVAKRLNLMLLN